MPANYVLLERVELNASAASVTFSNIPQSGYTDLKVVVSSRTTDTTTAGSITFNGTGTGFTGIRLFGSGSSVASGSSTAAVLTNSSGYTASTYSNSEIYIPNYAGSNYKSVSVDGVSENNATESYAMFNAILWSNTAAITSVTIAPAGGSFVIYSTFSLYGLAALGTTPTIAPKASGGSIYNDGTYWYHTFLSTGAFVPATALSCDVLVVAGGGSGGGNSTANGAAGGGGGAGALLYYASQSLTATSHTCTIGAGGSGSGTGSNGVNSSFGALTAATGGGQGGSFSTPTGSTLNGGSGGGGAGRNATETNTGGTGSQNFNGGTGYSGSGLAIAGGGGGGSSAAGSNAANRTGGAGGTAITSYSSWLSATNAGVSGAIAGGGGGGASYHPTYGNGTGGTTTGGGGAGYSSSGSAGAGTAGVTNTGGGGGGGGDNAQSGGSFNGGNGGSGIVIIRYPIA
jgi:hypothetical protein